METPSDRLPLAWVEDQEELVACYSAFDSRTLRQWLAVLKGPHREAIAAILAARGEPAADNA